MIRRQLSSFTDTWGLSTAALRFIHNKRPQYVIGADEVGYGALAGPYTVGAFLCPITWEMEGVKDSKRFTKRSSRENVANKLRFCRGTLFSVRYASHRRIDNEGKLQVLHTLFERAVRDVVYMGDVNPLETLIILDGEVKISLPHFPTIDADDHVPAVAAASILAKVDRDKWMLRQHEEWPKYGFDTNAGYGTKDHLEALKKYGPCEIHRRSYEPVTSMVERRR